MSTALIDRRMREAALVRHRLLLGLSCRDAISGGPAAVRVALESVGPFAAPGVLDDHGAGRHALRFAGAAARWVALCLERGEVPALVLSVTDAARRHVARRLRLLPMLAAGVPATGNVNIRECMLAPGAAYPLGTATAVRGRVLDTGGAPVAWARVLATVPAATLPFGATSVVGRATTDDRGEFLLLVDGAAVGGAALPANVPLRLRAFAPAMPLAAPPVEDDPGAPLPAGFAERATRTIDVPFGATFVADLNLP